MKYHDLLKRDSRITIMALSWRDIKSPTAGGAEVHTHEMLRRIDRSSYRVIHIAARYGREKESEMIDGVQYILKGNPVSVIWYAFFYYQRNRKNIDFVIDQCNTHRFFTPLWVPVTEAGVVGTPSVVVDSLGVRNAVDGGNAGYLCRKNHGKALAEEMERVLLDKELYEQKRELAYAFSCQFLWERNKEKIRKFLKEIDRKK